MNILDQKWWSRMGLGVLGMFVAIQLVPFGRLSAAEVDRLAQGFA